MAKKVKEKKSIIILGIEIKEDTVYEVVDRRPTDEVPDLYKKLKSVKFKNPNISNLVSFCVTGDYWDTGFFAESFVYSQMGLSLEEAELASKNAIDFVLKPMERLNKDIMNLVDPLVSQSGVDKFDNITTDIRVGRQFNTQKPRDRFDLYLAILSGQLSPVGNRHQADIDRGLLNENHHVYNLAQYSLEAKEDVRSAKEKEAKGIFTAYGKVATMLASNKKGIVSILTYEGVGVDTNMPDESIMARCQVFFENDTNIDNFLETVEKYETDNVFKDELIVMDVIKNKRGLKVLQKEGREYYLLGKKLGYSDRQVSSKIAKDDALYEEFLRLTNN